MGFWTPEGIPERDTPSEQDGQAQFSTDESLEELGTKIDEELAYRKKWL